MTQSRTHTCGELRLANAGETVTLVGWMENIREVGNNFAFLVLRDFYGTTQVVIENEEMMNIVKPLNKESTISVTGIVRERTSKNPKLPTGDIEIAPTEITVLGRCRYNELPFEINHSREADESQRLKYRYLDLRNPEVKANIILRCNVVSALRTAMTEHGFLEITTPILTASSPEGARDYLVPARKHPGKFYALPQAPQQFKQLLMTAGFDRYFQIAPCFRDEDARGDRSPGEFYQMDMEMAFASQEDVFAVIEDVLPPIFAKYGTYNIASSAPFARIPYRQAMEEFGSDKPDLRIDLRVKDVTDILQNCGFGPFENNIVKAVPVSNCKLARKAVDKLCADVEVQAGQKPYWFKVDESGAIAGGIAKFINADEKTVEAVKSALSLEPNTLVFLSAGKREEAQKTAGVMRRMLGAACEGHMDKERYEFCWIVDFPMYEIGEESGELEFCHNPFSMPSGGMETLLKAERGEIDPLDILADQYDLVCNGVELSSGAVRNHDPEIMVKAFEMVRLGEDDVKAKFPAMYNAFCYGAPPHAGIAPGVDRMVMLLSGEESIREVIAFPMNKSAQDVMNGRTVQSHRGTAQRAAHRRDGRRVMFSLEQNTYKNARLGDTDFTDAELRGYTFENCDLRGAMFSGALLEKCRFSACAFDFSRLNDILARGCSFENCTFSGASLFVTAFENCRVSGCSFAGADLTGWTVRGGTLEYCVLDHCPLKKQDFSGISLRGTSFAEADLEKADLSGCDLTETVFRNAQLKECDLRRAKFLRTDIRFAKMQKTKIDLEGAVYLAGLLGAVIN